MCSRLLERHLELHLSLEKLRRGNLQGQHLGGGGCLRNRQSFCLQACVLSVHFQHFLMFLKSMMTEQIGRLFNLWVYNLKFRISFLTF